MHVHFLPAAILVAGHRLLHTARIGNDLGGYSDLREIRRDDLCRVDELSRIAHADVRFEAIGVAGLGEQFLRLFAVRPLDQVLRPVSYQARSDDAGGAIRCAKECSLQYGIDIDGELNRLADADVFELAVLALHAKPPERERGLHDEV